MRRSALLFAVALLAVVGCGDDGGDERAEPVADEGADRDAYVEAVSASLEAEPESDLETYVDGTDCVAAAIVDSIGAEELDEAGITPEELADADTIDELGVEVPEQADVARRLGECDFDLTTVVDEQLSAQLGAGFELSPDARSCLSDDLEASVVDVVASTLIADEPGDEVAEGRAALGHAFQACPGAVTEMVVGAIEAQGLSVSPEARVCLEAGVRDRQAQLGEGELMEHLAAEVIAPCEGLLTG